MAAPIRDLVLIVIPVEWQDDITSAINHKGNMHPIRVSQNVLSNRVVHFTYSYGIILCSVAEY